jgi:hypothetical protein
MGKKKELLDLIDEGARQRKIAVPVWCCGIHIREHQQKHGHKARVGITNLISSFITKAK